jgi:lactoylglutathione lyase
MARIKHVTITTHDVEKTAAFYKAAFDLKEVGKGIKGVYLSDGFINFAVLKYDEGGHFKLGIDHLGFQVDDVDAAIAKVKELGAKPLTPREILTADKDPSTPQYYFEFRCAGPDDQHIDISSVGWVGAGDPKSSS